MMKCSCLQRCVLFLSLTMYLFWSCSKEDATVPSVTTSIISAISYTSASSGGTITDDGGATVKSCGICWSTTTDPTISDNKTTTSSGSKSFSATITNLNPNTTYYVRAYASNSAGSGYGNQLSFTTTAQATPSVTTMDISSIGQTTATSGGTISSDNGATVTARGVCWSTSSNPTVGKNSTVNGSGTGSFVSSITELQPGTIYYLRAYATNSVGTAYGNEIMFTTNSLTIPIVSTNSITNITKLSASGGGNITDDGGTSIITRGVCWSTVSNPTTSDFKTSDGTGNGNYSSNLTGLSIYTTYYVRAYATNSIGTAYGTEISFTTLGLTIGESYQGGKIVYILLRGDPGYDAITQHGLIVAPNDQSKGIRWYNGSYITVGITSITLGTGKANTDNIVSNQGVGSYAAKICSDLELDGYSDWYLPSRDELNKLYINRIAVGGIGTDIYWSSSEYNIDEAWFQTFLDSGQGHVFKNATYSVRAFRSF
jgi:hypothetical protein